MTMLTATLDLSVFHRLVDETKQILVQGTTEAVREGLNTGAAYARAHHQHQRRTGYLTSEAIRTNIDSVGSKGTMGALINDAPYAAFVEYGTKPHRIYPKNGGVLAFEATTPSAHGFTESSGTVFARFVNHPGTKPMAFMHPAALVAVEDMRRRLNDMVGVRIAHLWK